MQANPYSVRAFLPAIVLLLLPTFVSLHAAEPAYDPKLLEQMVPRPIGPANMSGRIVGVAVVESKPAIMYLASASGGVWKTTDDGATFMPVFEHEGTSSIGEVAVAQSNPEVVWAGTGEANARNSVSSGDGVYKSTDGGGTWHNMGLRDTRHIGRIVIHPTNPDIVYVAALGHLWGPSKERGIFETTDGGKTWQNVCFLDENTGFIDLAMDPTDSNVLYGCAYQVRRDGFDGNNPAIQTGPRAGIYKTEDGGKTWTKLTQGLPSRPLGRCGIAIYRKDPRVLFAVVQTDLTKMIRASELGQEARTGDQPDTGGVFRSDDAGKTWTKLNDLCPRPFYYGQIRIDPNDSRRIWVLGVTMHLSTDGGRSFRILNWPTVHNDHHALWIDPANSGHMVDGNDGGLYFSHDHARSWEHLKNLPLAQFYSVALDTHSPYRVFGGLQDNGSWGGPVATHFREGISTADWFRIAAADGFYCAVDPNDLDTVYCESQYGGFIKRLNLRGNNEKEIQPLVARGRPAYRFNWCTPILVSTHSSSILYAGGNHLFRSANRGDSWEEVSPDLTLGRPGPSPDQGHTITTIAESPVRARTLWVGTDDGRIHVSRTSGGANWTDLSDRLPGVPAERCITRIECSHFDEGTAYLTLSRHRNDDPRPYIFKTSDFGATWTSLVSNLPPLATVHLVREDLENRDLLFAGTEQGLFLSGNGGAFWQPIRKSFPTVPVRDLAIHPRDRDLVIGTHGRGVWVLDIRPLEELTPAALAQPVVLLEIKPTTVFAQRPPRASALSKSYIAPNPDFGAVIHYYLRDRAVDPVKVVVADLAGKTLAILDGSPEPGLHRLVWDLRSGKSDDGKPFPLVKPGEYQVRLEIGEAVLRKRVRVEPER